MTSCTDGYLLILVFWVSLLGNAGSENLRTSAQSTSDVRFAAWNIRTFGRSKMAKPAVVASITKIIQRYDLVLIQEIRDNSGNAIQKLLTRLNNQSPKNPFRMSLSARLGRTRTKEQYAFLYRSSKLKVVAEYQYPDRSDKFEREPYSVRFSAKGTGEFVVMAIHTSPLRAKNEISALYRVFKKLKKRWKTEKILIAGDLNAGCDYVRSWKGISLHSDKQFQWLISDAQDTTATSTNCPYDRLIVHDALFSSVLRGSARVLRFDDLLGLSTAEALLVSDHYPVQLRFKAKQAAIMASPGVSDVSRSATMVRNDIRKTFTLVFFAVIMFRT